MTEAAVRAAAGADLNPCPCPLLAPALSAPALLFLGDGGALRLTRGAVLTPGLRVAACRGGGAGAPAPPSLEATESL